MQPSEYFRIEKMENVHFWYRGMGQLIMDFLKIYLKIPAKILDAGCGTGSRAEECHIYGKVTAIDINNTALKLANKKNIHQVRKADICDLPFDQNTFDAVLCLDVLYHRSVKNDLLALKECLRVLKPGKIILLRVPAFEFLRGSHDIVVYTRKRYSASEIRKLLLLSGFKIKRLTYSNMLLSIPLMAKRLYERFFIADHNSHSDSELPPEFINRFFFKIILLENQILRYMNLPFGSSVIAIGEKPNINLSKDPSIETY